MKQSTVLCVIHLCPCWCWLISRHAFCWCWRWCFFWRCGRPSSKSSFIALSATSCCFLIFSGLACSRTSSAPFCVVFRISVAIAECPMIVRTKAVGGMDKHRRVQGRCYATLRVDLPSVSKCDAKQKRTRAVEVHREQGGTAKRSVWLTLNKGTIAYIRIS